MKRRLKIEKEKLRLKRQYLEKVRENLEKSGNFCKIFQKSWNFFQNALNLMIFSEFGIPIFEILLSEPTMVDYCKTDRCVFKEHDFFYYIMKNLITIFDQERKVYFHL